MPDAIEAVYMLPRRHFNCRCYQDHPRSHSMQSIGHDEENVEQDTTGIFLHKFLGPGYYPVGRPQSSHVGLYFRYDAGSALQALRMRVSLRRSVN